jgi:hypothetical protein
VLHCKLAHGFGKLYVETRIIRLCKYTHVCGTGKLRVGVELRFPNDLELKEVKLVKDALHLQAALENSLPKLPLLLCGIASGVEHKLRLIAAPAVR